jgi:glycosyltransferase involved in cell wall biosynthesis
VSARSPSTLKVVAYTDAAGIGGAEISLGHLVATVSDEVNIVVVGVNQTVVEAIATQRPQAKYFILPAKGVWSFVRHLWTFWQLQADIIHCNLCTPWACAIGLSAALFQPQVRVVQVNQLPLRTTGLFHLLRTRMLSLRVDAHVAVGEASARRMEDFYALGRQTVLSIPNCVPDEKMFELPIAKSPGNLLVGSIGRLDRMKGHDVLLQAIAQVDGVKVTILGEGNERKALEQLAEKLGVSDRVSLPGWVDNPREHLAGFDVVVMPSRSEGFPLAIVEAMLAARPVIATRVGSIPEAIIDRETGILVEKDQVDELAVALRRLRDEPELRWQMGKRGREVAESQFTVEKMAASYEALWRRLRSQPPNPRFLVPRPRD